MAKIDEIKESISLMSKLLMVALAAIIATAGGIASLVLSLEKAQSGILIFMGILIIIALSVVSWYLIKRCWLLIGRLGEVE